MARALVIEEESGTYTGRRHPHNDYYAGDFSASRSATVEPRRPPRRGTCTSFPGSPLSPWRRQAACPEASR